MAKKRIGILTGGGDCPGLNAVVRAAAKTALHMDFEIIGFRDGYAGLVEDRYIPLDDAAVSGILARGGTILGTSNTANPFSYTLSPCCSADKPKDLSGQALEVFRHHSLDALIAIGGDGTLSIGLKLQQIGIPVIGVPKTIDNDLAATDVTFGFDSALTVATDAVDKLHTTAEAHHRVMILETMGRYAGWIALRAGIAGGGDIILLPEIPYSSEDVCSAITARMARGKNFSIVVVAEGAAEQGGGMTVASTVKGSPDPLRLGGVGYKVSEYISKKCGVESRVVVLGHLQRGGTPTAYDRWLATRFGEHAMELAASGTFGRMVCLHGTEIRDVAIKDAVSMLRRVDPQGEEVRTAIAVGTTFGVKSI
jgi:6-phosphofructokinase 1